MRCSGPWGRSGLWSWISFAACCFFQSYLVVLRSMIWYRSMIWCDNMWSIWPCKKWLVKQASILNLHGPNCNTHTCFECLQTSDLNIMFDSIQVAVGFILIFFSVVGYKNVACKCRRGGCSGGCGCSCGSCCALAKHRNELQTNFPVWRSLLQAWRYCVAPVLGDVISIIKWYNYITIVYCACTIPSFIIMSHGTVRIFEQYAYTC